MNVKIGTAAAQFPEKECINGIFVEVYAFIRGLFSCSAKVWKRIYRMAWVQIPKYVFRYEPLYVARANTPPFDERFVGFGMTRNSQVRQIHILFFVLYSTLLHLPPLRFHCADRCWDRTQDRCNLCIGSQTL
jgi:hypothetical protein